MNGEVCFVGLVVNESCKNPVLPEAHLSRVHDLGSVLTCKLHPHTNSISRLAFEAKKSSKTTADDDTVQKLASWLLIGQEDESLVVGAFPDRQSALM